MNAPVCPVSQNQPPGGTHAPITRLPVIPIATDLPSLIRAVNIIQDVLRSITTSLTVNNVWEPQTGGAVFVLSEFPSWAQVDTDRVEGYVYYKAKDQEPDKNQRAYVQRTNSVEFRNREAGGESFFWRLKKPLDSEYGDSNGVKPFEEDFFERVVNVHWSLGLAVEFFDGSR